MASELRSKTVSRFAFFGGGVVGVVILVSGLWAADSYTTGLWKIPLEMAVVAVAYVVTTGLWRRSAESEPILDSPSEPTDRRE